MSAAHVVGGCGMGSGPQNSVTDAWGRIYCIPWLRVADSSLFPDALEINPYVPVMALADRVTDYPVWSTSVLRRLHRGIINVENDAEHPRALTMERMYSDEGESISWPRSMFSECGSNDPASYT